MNWRKHAKYILAGAAAVLLLGGSYLLLLNLSPRLVAVKSSIDLDTSDDNTDRRNRIQIAKLNLEVPFFAGNSPEILERGVWHRYSERGDPKKGGNFILSAHRFLLGFTPMHTKERSPFYNIGKLAVGDEIKIYFDEQWYSYKIDKIYKVKPQQVSIESPSDTAKLTLYTCSMKGSADGRVVLEATQS
jgi:LPXTG-site transpeptidase (sortase) family protein